MNPDRVWPLVSAEEMRGLDRHTIATLGVDGEILMESAGRAVTERVLALLHESAVGDDPVVIVCGGGNNGGDGFVVARHLAVLGVPVYVALLGRVERLPPDAARNHERMLAFGVALHEGLPQLPAVGLIVDALFGTGLARPLEGAAAEAVAWINVQAACGVPVVAVDLPSGLDADTGQVLGVAVRASETVTVGLPKIGLCLEPGRDHAGKIHVARIGIVDEAPDTSPRAELWTRPNAAARLPARPAAGHKGSFGHVLVIAGSRGKTGAAHLAALGCARAGAGLVTVACPAGVGEILEVKTTEAMTAPVPDTEDHSLAIASASRLLALAHERDIVAVGPGIGLHAETVSLMHELAKRVERPMVIDADGLNAFADEAGTLALLNARSEPTILTPHPGEAARLLGSTSAAVNGDRVGAARRLAERSGAVVVLKGAATVVADPEGRVAINPTGGPALGTGGTGDVLTGVVAGLFAQGLGAFEAATLGVFIHGDAADRIAARSGASGLLASELADEVPACCASLRASGPGEEGLRDERGRSLLLRFPGA